MTVLRREDVQSKRRESETSASRSQEQARRSSESCLGSSAVVAVRRRPQDALRYAATSGCKAAQRKPLSSRATATATFGVGL